MTTTSKQRKKNEHHEQSSDSHWNQYNDDFPSVQECTEVIKKLAKNNKKHTKELAQLFTTCIAFLFHLDVDSERIEESKVNNPQDVPAISAILGDKEVFTTFLNMLHTPIKSTSAAMNVSAPMIKRSGSGGSRSVGQNHQSKVMHISRKRSISLDVEDNVTSNKCAKKMSMLSPIKSVGSTEAGMSSNTTNSTNMNSNNIPVPPSLPSMSNHHDKQSSPLLKIKFPVLAATIFYSALRHFHQWPAALVKVYTEDCFGARSWVDDERCHLLTENLSLVLRKQNEENSSSRNEKSNTTKQFVESFNMFFLSNVISNSPKTFDEIQAPELKSLQRTDSLKSVSSDSGDEILEVKSSGSVLKDSSSNKEKISSINTMSSSSSGEEEMEEKVDVTESATKSLRRPSSLTTSEIKTNGSSGGNETNDVSNFPPLTNSPSSLDRHRVENWWYPELVKTMKSTTSSSLRNQVYSRYIGSNKIVAHKMIAVALANRLSAQGIKQNSTFLSALPTFVSLPEIRKLAAAHLERWLQSPAVSNLAKSLLSTMVAEMKNIDPPLEEDIAAIDCILVMNLKANQFISQKENVISIVKTIPTVAICRHIVLRLLTDELKNNSDLYCCIDNKQEVKLQKMDVLSEKLEMFLAVHLSLEPEVAYDALASAILTLLFHNEGDVNIVDNKKPNLKASDSKRVQELLNLLNRVMDLLGNGYNGYLLIKIMLENTDMKTNNNGVVNDHLRLHQIARIIYECVTLIVPPFQQSNSSLLSHRGIQSKSNRKSGSFGNNQRLSTDHEYAQLVSSKLLKVRKIILKWYLNSFATALSSKSDNPVTVRKKILKKNGIITNKTKSNLNREEGAGIPDYFSVLDGITKIETSLTSSNSFVGILRCLLFIEKPESKELSAFLSPNLKLETSGAVISEDKKYKVQVCCDYGVDVDNEIIRIVLSSALDNSMAISLIEHLFYQCRDGQKAVVMVDDCDIIWDLYTLTEYIPQPVPPVSVTYSDTDSDNEDGLNINEVEESDKIPRLAYPGLWWRVTMIALIICGKSPQTIGSKLWDEHPTLRVLIKMITTDKYSFPTVDCNDSERETMKKNEYRLRGEESNVTEALFFPKPKSQTSKVKKNSKIETLRNHSRLRVSARQIAKQEKIKAERRKIEIAEALAEERRRKKLLKIAQKSIMIYDLASGARKPPKESVDLLYSAVTLFQLSREFKKCVKPDFVLLTIGSTSRQSIERAYDWLIPIVSSHPNMISRLPPSASCYLLLRVFGVDDAENRQLLKLSAPLLNHVTQCLSGSFGQQDTQRAGDILFFDIADQNPDRRSCARRALQESLGKLDHESGEENKFRSEEFSWLFTLLHTKHSSELGASAVSNVSRALVFERGNVLRGYILALHHYFQCGVPALGGESWNFASIICDLLSTRPHVCSALIDRFVDVRNLTIEVVYNEFQKCISASTRKNSNDIKLFMYVSCQAGCERSEVNIYIALLRASILLISNWRGDDESSSKHDSTSMSQCSSRDALMSLVRYLIPISMDSLCKFNTDDAGAANAKFVISSRRAVSVKEWVMLAKSRCDFIARHSALSVPGVFLPRLLLCCGLPQSSLLSMIERLGKLGDESSDRDKYFGELLSPSATIEWDLGHISKRSLIVRKLLGRISANINILLSKDSCNDTVTEAIASSSFISWLTKECQNDEDKLKKSRSRKSSSNKRQNILSKKFYSTSTISTAISSIFRECNDEIKEETSFEMDEFIEPVRCFNNDSDIARPVINVSSESTIFFLHLDFIELDSAIEEAYTRFVRKKVGSPWRKLEEEGDENKDELNTILEGATHLVNRYRSLSVSPVIFTETVLRWVPILSQGSKESFWEAIFTKPEKDSEKEVEDMIVLLVTRCIAVWSTPQILSCQSWMLEKIIAEELRDYSISLFLKVLVNKSMQLSYYDFPSTHRDGKEAGTFVAIEKQPKAMAAVRLALEGAKCCAEGSFKKLKNIGREKITLPDWMILLLLVGKQGKRHLDLMTTMLVDRLPSESWEGQILPCTLLRLYSQFPSVMSLKNAKTRQILVKAAAEIASDWLQWRTPLDDQVECVIFNLQSNPTQRQQQLLSDFSKRYPLITCKHISCMTEALKKDASIFPRYDAENRGRVICVSKYDSAIAETENSTMKVNIKLWGYAFSEPLWGATLDVLMTLPGEVIFVCGHRVGLLELLNVYLKLFITNVIIGGIDPNPALMRIKDKFLNFSNNFQSYSRSDYCMWLKSELKGVLQNGCTIEEVFKQCGMELKVVSESGDAILDSG